MAKNCARHPDAPAIAVCTHCRKPLCQPCTLVTPAGAFCSPECSILRREAAAQAPRGRRKHTGALTVLLLVLVAATGLFFVHLEARGDTYPRDHWLKRIDLIGRFIFQRQ